MCTNQWSSSYTLNRVGPLFSVHTNTLIKNNLKGHIMFGSIISDTFKFAGKLIGESVHQVDELYEGTKNVVVTVATDISNIPQAIIDGYNEELFEKKPTPTDSVTPDEPTTVA